MTFTSSRLSDKLDTVTWKNVTDDNYFMSFLTSKQRQTDYHICDYQQNFTLTKLVIAVDTAILLYDV